MHGEPSADAMQPQKCLPFARSLTAVSARLYSLWLELLANMHEDLCKASGKPQLSTPGVAGAALIFEHDLFV